MVGGAVRDMILGIEAKDIDYVVVGATPEDMLFKGYKQVGADFPVFLHPITGDEYALARTERKSGKGYLGFSVETSGVTIEDDLQRRDLTINAMAMKSSNGTHISISSSFELIDPYNGQADLKAGILRHVSESFSEDPLRVLRIARFAARFGFEVAPETLDLCRSLVASGELATISRERFWKEMDRALGEKNPAKFFEVLDLVGALWNPQVPFFYECFKDKDKLSTALFYKPKPEIVYAIVSDFARMDKEMIIKNKVSDKIVKLSQVYANFNELISIEAFKLAKGNKIASWLKTINTDELFTNLIDCICVEWPGDSGFFISEILNDCRDAYNSVTAAGLITSNPELGGRALGEAINKQRGERITSTIERFSI